MHFVGLRGNSPESHEVQRPVISTSALVTQIQGTNKYTDFGPLMHRVLSQIRYVELCLGKKNMRHKRASNLRCKSLF